MNKKIKLQVFLYALLALLIPFFAWSRGEEIKVERKLPVAKYVAKGGVGELSNQNIIHEKELITPTELTLITSDAPVPTIYGSLVYSGAWASLPVKDWKYGVYSIPTAKTTSELVADIDVSEVLTATLAGDKYYTISRRMESNGAVAQIYMYVYDVKTWQLLEEVELEPDWQYLPLVISYDKIDNEIYALKYSDDWLTYELAILNTATGEMTTISTLGDVETMPSIYTLSGAVDGNLYAVCTDGKFYSIEKKSGKMTAIGALGCVPTGIQSTIYDYATQTMYWAAVTTSDETMLCSINMETGAASIINRFPEYEEYVGLYILEANKPSNTPENVEAQFNFDAPASLSGELEVIVPDKTIAGEDITEDLIVEIYVDNEQYESFEAVPGSKLSKKMNFVEGKHILEITATYQGQTSDKTYLSLFAGYDSPNPVQHLKLEISDDDEATLTWDEVTESLNGGFVAFDELRYRVIRADGSIAAENLSENRFSEKLTGAIMTYYYKVVAYTSNAESRESVSNKVKHGSYYAIPYFNNFEKAESVEGEYTFIDNNNDREYVWSYANSYDGVGYVLQYNCNWNSYKSADDYAVTPAIKFEKAKYYKLTFQHILNESWSEYINDLELMIGTEATVDALNMQIADFQDITNSDTDTKDVYFTVPDDGMYHVAFHIYSGAGQGLFWVNDLGIEEVGLAEAPASVDFELTPINEEPEKVEVRFVSPEKKANGATLQSIDALKIYRDEDLEPAHVINNPKIGETYQWTDDAPTLGLTHYRVVAENNVGESFCLPKSVFVGGYIPPYSETFDSSEHFDFFEIINANNDEKTWYFNNGTAKYEYDITNSANDWLFSPAIKMQSDRVYKISFTGRSTIWNPENMKMTIGTAQSTRDQKVLVNLKDWSVEDFETHYAYYIPGATTKYYVGFHAYSKRASTFIEIDEVSVEDMYSAYAPSKVLNLEADADVSGLPKAIIKFDSPATNALGEPIEALSKIEIYRNDVAKPVYTFENPEIGTALTWVDESVSFGENRYRIIPFNEHGEGIDNFVEVYVGYDTPAVVNDCKIKGDENNANAIISWTAPTIGANGGHINSETLTYNVYREDEYGQFNLLANGLTETTYVDEMNYDGVQKGVRYAVAAKTAEGISLGIIRSVVLGSLYQIPFEESYSNGNVSTYQWTISTPSTEACAIYMSPEYYTGTENVYPQDSDAGFLRFARWNDDNELADAYVTSPKFSIKATEKPCVSFYLYHISHAGVKNKLTPYISVNDGDAIALDDPISIKANQNGWVRYSYPLDDYKDSNHVKITFYTELYDNNSSMLLDAFVVDNAYDYNLSINSFEGSAEIGVDGGEFTAEVKNRAANVVESYDVLLYCNDEVVATQTLENLEAFSKVKVKFNVDSPSVAEAGKVRKYQTEVVFDKDQNASDNKSQILESVVYTPPYPTISDLRGYASDYDNANLEWSEPELIYYPPVMESFEAYELFTTDDMGAWTLVDVDEQRTFGPKYGVTFPEAFTPKAWQVIDPQMINLYAEDCAPHSGANCLMSMGSDGQLMDGTIEVPCNDDWLISEEVLGGSQIKFWAKQPTSIYGNEKFEVLYSTSNKKVDNFILIEEVELQNMAVWNEFVYTLPEDAKYFAIRHTYAAFGLWLDDITYHPLSVNEALNVENYNIYRDNVKVGESQTCSYKDENLPDGTYNYAVTANFNIGESALSNVVEILIDKSSVETIENSDISIVCAENQMIVVKNADGSLVEVFLPDGKIYYSQQAEGVVKIPVEMGVYIIKIGDYIEKLIIK